MSRFGAAYRYPKIRYLRRFNHRQLINGDRLDSLRRLKFCLARQKFVLFLLGYLNLFFDHLGLITQLRDERLLRDIKNNAGRKRRNGKDE